MHVFNRRRLSCAVRRHDWFVEGGGKLGLVSQVWRIVFTNQINNNAKMKKLSKAYPVEAFESGELYLFHPTKRNCPSADSLWGVYNRCEDGLIYLESSTLDMHSFARWSALPTNYRYSRPASRSELRDYMYNLGWTESREM